MALAEGQEKQMVLSRVVVISTMKVVNRSSKARSKVHSRGQHLPP